MQLIEIKQKWPSDLLLINYAIHNVCNYKCWYCFPGSNEGTYRWPEYDLVVDNIIHLLKYYQKNAGKNRFQFDILGGEPTLWPKLGKFVQQLKKDFGDNISIGITTNGSRSFNWWYNNLHYFDKVLISVHPSDADPAHISKIADLIYENKKIVDVTVLMDPQKWDHCKKIIELLKKSKYRWSIQTSQVMHELVDYNNDQKKYLKNYLKRIPNLFWFYKNSTHYNYSTKLFFNNGKIKKVRKNFLLINKLNSFKNWDCNIGVDNITVHFTGEISGSCGEKLYGLDYKFNLYDKEFKSIFNPVIRPTICNQLNCHCQHEYNTSKKNNLKLKKIIPIYEN